MGLKLTLTNSLQPPSSKFLLGTDMLGRDILSRLLAGIRTDLLIGLAAAAAVSIIAIGWATLAARCKRMNNWRGDTLEDIVLLPRDIICAFPWLVLLLLVISLPGNKGVILITLLVGLVILPRNVSILQEAFSSLTQWKGRLQNVLRAISIAFIFTTAGVIFYVALLQFLGFRHAAGYYRTRNSGEFRHRIYAKNAMAGNRAACGFVGNTDYRCDDRRGSCRKVRLPLLGVLVEDIE